MRELSRFLLFALVALLLIVVKANEEVVSLSPDVEEGAIKSPRRWGSRNLQDTQDLNFSTINSVLEKVDVVVPTDVIPDTRQRENFPGGSIEVVIQVGGRAKAPGRCFNFRLDGALGVNGEELPVENGLQREEFSVAGEGLQLRCEIPLRVKVDKLTLGFIDINLGGLQSEKEGNFIAVTQDGLAWSQQFVLESPDFTTTPPNSTLVGECTFDLGELSIDAQDVLQVFDNLPIGDGINLDPIVERQLREDVNLIAAPLTEAICGISVSAAESLGDLLSRNPFTNIGPNSIITGGGFFDTDDDGVIDAIEREAELIKEVAEESINFARGNFIVDILFPEGGEDEENLLAQFFESFELGGVVVDQNDAVGLVVALLNDAFNLTLTRPIVDLELIPLIKTIIDIQGGNDDIFVEDDDGKLSMVFVDETFNFTGISLTVKIEAPEFLMSENGGTNDDIGFFDGMAIFSNFSVILPNFDLGDYIFNGTIVLDFAMSVDAAEAGLTDFIESFDIVLPQEVLTFSGSIEKFFAKAAGLVPINEEKLDDLKIGEVLEEPLGCVTSTLSLPAAVLTAFGGDADRIDASVAGFKDIISNIVGDILNAMVFSYQSVILRGLETMLSEPLLDPPVEILEQGECPNLVFGQGDFNFQESVLQEAEEVADAEFFESLIGFVVSSEGEVEIDFIEKSDPVDFGLSLFSAGGFKQEVDFLITKVTVIGISPPVVNSGSFSLPDVQLLRAEVDFLTSDDRLKLQIEGNITINEPIEDPEAEFVAETVPAIFLGTSSDNFVSLSMELENVKALVDVLASLSEFDVLDTKISLIARTDCWVARLNQPGGFSNIDVEIAFSEMKMECDCESNILNQVTESITQVSGFNELNNDIQSLVNAVAGSFVDKFNEDNFAFTQENANKTCADEDEIQKEFSTAAAGKKDPAAFAFIGILAAVLLFTFPFLIGSGLERRVKANRRNPLIIEEEKSSKRDKPMTAEEQAVVLAKMEKFDVENKGKGEDIPMYRNGHIPGPVRVLVVCFLFLNFALFIIGDFGVSLQITLQGNLLESPLPPQDFGSFSVVTSTIDLYENGAVGLAILIFIVALFWPYFKMLSLSLCFFSSPKFVSLKFRGNFIHFLDVFGKWSTVEVFFVVFLRLLFELSIGSPRTLYLPDTDIYSIELLITPQVSFYTFGTAVLISILLSNVLMVYHEKIIRRNKDDLRNVLSIEKTNMNVFTKVSMSDYLFLRKMSKVDGSADYAYKFSPKGLRWFTVFTVACMFLTLIANNLFVAKVRYLGIARIFLEVSDQESEPAFSVFSIVGDVVSKGIREGDMGAVYFGIVIVFVQLFAPIGVLISTLMILYKGMSLKDASRHRILRGCIAAWSTLEVFILSIAIAVIEVPAVAKALTEDSCDFFVEFMGETLLPLGLVNEEDVQNTCFGVKVEIPAGAYLYLIAIFANLLNAVIVLRMFNEMIKQRHSVAQQVKEEAIVDRNLDEISRLDRNMAGDGKVIVHYSKAVSMMKFFGFLIAFPKKDGVKV